VLFQTVKGSFIVEQARLRLCPRPIKIAVDESWLARLGLGLEFIVSRCSTEMETVKAANDVFDFQFVLFAANVRLQKIPEGAHVVKRVVEGTRMARTLKRHQKNEHQIAASVRSIGFDSSWNNVQEKCVSRM